MEYRFLLTRLNGDPCLDRFEDCASDEQALATARRKLGPNSNKLRVEVWRGSELIYMGLPSKRTPFAPDVRG